MTGNTELAKVLNENFRILDEHGHKREIAILGRLREIEKSLKEHVDWKIDPILNHFGIDPGPGPELLQDSDESNI